MKQLTFDPTRIDYAWDEERERYGERSAAVCEALNRGEPFAIVFSQPLWEEDGEQVVYCQGDTDLYYAMVVLGDGGKIPYPLFEEAAGLVFKERELQEYWEESGVLEVTATLIEFEEWLIGHFGQQYVGWIEARSGDQSDRRDAIAWAARLARGELRPEEAHGELSYMATELRKLQPRAEWLAQRIVDLEGQLEANSDEEVAQ